MSKGRSTTSIHGKIEPTARPVTYPIYQTAAFSVESNEAYARLSEYGGDEYFYTRYDNPTLRNVSEKLAKLEHAEECLLFASGMNAITTALMTFLSQGDTIASSRALYGGTLQFFRDYAPRYGIKVVLLDEDELYEVDQHVPDAKIVYFETPVNPRTDCLSIRRVVEALGTNRPVVDIRPMQYYVDQSIGDTRFMMLMLTAFAAASLLLAGIGLYGTLAYLISQRTQEFGVRMALGANAAAVAAMVAREGALLAGGGAAIGMAVALAVAGSLRSLLYGVAPIDATTVVSVACLIAIVAIAAASLPAWRAARVDPAVALRSE